MPADDKILPLSTVFERDVDLILAEEFQCSLDFIAWFWSRVRSGQMSPVLTSIDEVRVRQRDLVGGEGSGETDLTVDLPVVEAGKLVRTRLLIENKIAAAFQPKQPERYAAQLREAIDGGQCDRGWCVLVAPAEYVRVVPGCQVFDARVTYEEIQAFFGQAAPQATDETRRRRQFRWELLRQALTKQSADWTPNDPTGQGIQFFRKVYELASRIAPQLKMANPETKSPRGWIHLKSALTQRPGFTSEICVKQDSGCADIQLSKWGPHLSLLREALTPLLDSELSLLAATQSAAVRIAIPKFSGEQPFEPQADAIAEGLRKILKLHAWYERHLPQFESLSRAIAAKGT